MGVTTDPVAPPDVAAAPSTRARLLRWFDRPTTLANLALGSLAANVAIVVSGGAVRLTNSGLGCPTWPQCTDSSLTPTKRYAIHGIIEFTNRQLTFLVGAIALVTLVAAWRQHRQRRLAAIAFGGIPAQAVLGGITVLTELNPYAVAAHFLLSMAVVAAYALLVWRTGRWQTGYQGAKAPAVVSVAARGLVAVTAAVLAFGTVVTGSGPHAGDLKAGRLHRIHLSPQATTQLHADAVMLLIGLTVGMVMLTYLAGAAGLRRAAWTLLAVELAQGVIGYTQYFLHVPAGLVAVHMFGACLVWLAALRVLFLADPRCSPTDAGARRNAVTATG